MCGLEVRENRGEWEEGGLRQTRSWLRLKIGGRRGLEVGMRKRGGTHGGYLEVGDEGWSWLL